MTRDDEKGWGLEQGVKWVEDDKFSFKHIEFGMPRRLTDNIIQSSSNCLTRSGPQWKEQG